MIRVPLRSPGELPECLSGHFPGPGPGLRAICNYLSWCPVGVAGGCLAGVLAVKGCVRGAAGPTLARAGRAALPLPAICPAGPAAGSRTRPGAARWLKITPTHRAPSPYRPGDWTGSSVLSPGSIRPLGPGGRKAPFFAYYDKKLAEGKNPQRGAPVPQAPDQRRHLRLPSHRRRQAASSAEEGPGGQLGNDPDSSAAVSHPERRLFGQATPGPDSTLRPATPARATMPPEPVSKKIRRGP